MERNDISLNGFRLDGLDSEMEGVEEFYVGYNNVEDPIADRQNGLAGSAQTEES
jgi:hypothetical protein